MELLEETHQVLSSAHESTRLCSEAKTLSNLRVKENDILRKAAQMLSEQQSIGSQVREDMLIEQLAEKRAAVAKLQEEKISLASVSSSLDRQVELRKQVQELGALASSREARCEALGSGLADMEKCAVHKTDFHGKLKSSMDFLHRLTGIIWDLESSESCISGCIKGRRNEVRTQFRYNDMGEFELANRIWEKLSE